jgi:predicted MPP superfamily phosphohydrolase
MQQSDRRQFLKLAGLAGVTFTAGLFPKGPADAQAADFHFVQISDTHWGYKGKANPDAEHTLEQAIVTVNSLARQPDFIVFTGDLTHTTEDPKERRARMKRVREIIGDLKVKDVRFLPGENDAHSTRAKPTRSSSATRTTPSITRACTSSPSTTCPTHTPHSATSSSPGSPPT